MKDKREKILETALTLFVEQGFHNTPTSKIAQEAGVATGTLFHHFKTKKDLINALYLDTKTKMLSAIIQDIDESDSTKAAFKKIWYNTLHWGLFTTEEYLFFQQFMNSMFIDNETREQGEDMFTGIIEMIDKGKQNEVLKNIPTKLMLDFTTGGLFATINHLLSNPEKIGDDEYHEFAFQLFWDSIKG